MAARPRMRKRGQFPSNLYEPREGYFVWRDPRDGVTHKLGRIPLAQAIYEAQRANAKIAAGKISVSLADRIDMDSTTIADLLAKMPVSEKPETAASRKQLDKVIREKYGSLPCRNLTTKHVADLLEEKLNEGKSALTKLLRSRFVAICKRGMSLGLMEHNAAANTEGVKVVVKRRRLTFEEFQAIYEKAPLVADWLQNAMLLALVSGQDRLTCARWPRKCVYDGYARVHRQKTGVTIEIPVSLRLDVLGKSLEEVIAQCRSSGVISPYLVHHIYSKRGTNRGDPVAVEALTSGFAEARRLAGIVEAGAPTFHEIRSLAKRLYDKQGGVDTKTLLGHMTDETARLYANPRGIEPMRVKISA